jgi:hypothetical protein
MIDAALAVGPGMDPVLAAPGPARAREPVVLWRAGFVAADAQSVARSDGRVGCWRRGTGTHPLDWAESRSGASLWLCTFARTAGARAFDERHGFAAEAHGLEPTWPLGDVHDRWGAKVRHAAAGADG